MIYKASPISDNANPIIIKVTFSFRKFVWACKKISSFHKSIHKIQQILQPKTWKTTPFLTTTIQKLLKQVLATSIFDKAHPIFFNQLLISMNLCQHAQNQTFLSFSEHLVNISGTRFPSMGFVEEYNK